MRSKLDAQTRAMIQKNHSLSNYLTRLDSVTPHTPRSWLYENRDANSILDEWLAKLHRLSSGNPYEKAVYHFDTAQLSKWGPQGGHPGLAETLKTVEPSFSPDAPSPGLDSTEWSEALDTSLADLRQRALTGVLRRRAPGSVVDDMRARDVLESNSGLPLFQRRNKPEVKESSLNDAVTGKWRDYAAILLTRFYNNKLRPVWMFPMSTNIVEGQFVQPAMELLMKYGGLVYNPWRGFEVVKKQIHEWYSNGLFVSASDFSATDSTFRVPQAKTAFHQLELLFQRQEHADMWDSIHHMLHIPLVISPTEWLTGDHGVASGSGWTNFIETLFDVVFIRYLKSLTGMAIGDDICYVNTTYRKSLPEEIEEKAKSVGMQSNAEKVSNKRDQVKYLQRLFQRGYVDQSGITRGVYPTIRALKSSIYPEKFHNPKDWSSDMFCARQYMILENTVDHPMFEEFVKFVVAGQKDLIPFAKYNYAKLSEITRRSRLLPGLNPTYNQEKRDSTLANFRSIQIAREL